jgi:probable O-glycosylation ligase (exosortase A-associated)
MRDYLLTAIVLAAIPVGLFHPFYGLLFYAWISYMNPHLLTWTFARTLPVAKMTGIATLAGVLIHRNGDLRPLRQTQNVLMLLLLLIFTVSSTFALHPSEAWRDWQNLTKIILMALVTSLMITSKPRLRIFLLVVAFSIGIYGIKGGLFSLAVGGESIVWGPGDSIIGANNAIGLALNMCLPLFWYLAANEKSWWLKRTLQLSFFLSIPAIMFTYARASALGLGAVLLAIVLRMRGLKKALILVLAVAVAASVFAILPEKWVARQQTIADYEQDRSAMSRLGEWTFCWRLAVDRPLVGGGFQFYSRQTYQKYAPEFLAAFRGIAWNSHSVYFGILAAHGFPGLIVFLLILLSSYYTLRRIRIQVKEIPDLQWLANYSNMIQVSLIGFAVNGAFVNMEYFDLVYHLFAITASLAVLARDHLSPVPSAETGDSTLARTNAARVSSEPIGDANPADALLVAIS